MVNRLRIDHDQKKRAKKSILITIGKNAFSYAEAILNHNPGLFDIIWIYQATGYTDAITLNDSKIYLELVDHPIPSNSNFQSTLRFLEFMKNVPAPSYLHFVITGGTSSCFALPEEGLSETQYQNSMENLLLRNINIFEFNEIRATIDALKGGKLALILHNHFVHTSVVSDVLNNDVRYVGSGPTLPGIVIGDRSAMILQEIAKQFDYSDQIDQLNAKLQKVSRYSNSNHTSQLLVSSTNLINHVLNELTIKLPDYTTSLIETTINLDVDTFSTEIAETFPTLPKRSIHIWAGELTTELYLNEFKSTQGGRLSLFSYLLSKKIENDSRYALIALATDGKDGSSPVSCYIITNSTYSAIQELPGSQKLIDNGNSGYLFSLIDFGINLNPTNINFADIFILIRY